MTLTAKTAAPTRTLHHAVPLWRLLWKEFSERRWWAICWALAILAMSLFAHGQRFCGDAGSTPKYWHALSLIFAGVIGLGGYTSELQRGRAFFLFSRAVHWQEVLLAKLLFGAIIILGVPLLAAGIFFLTCPEPYRHFVTLPNVLTGIGALALPLALCYLGGLVCSVILPGLAGGVLTVASIAITVIVILGCIELIEWLCYSLLINDLTPSIELHFYSMRVGVLFFATISILVGSLTAVRSGLYRDYPQRIKLFSRLLLPAVVIGGLVGLCLPQPLIERLFVRWYPEDSGYFSPGGSYAIVQFQQRYTVCGMEISNLFGLSPINYRTDLIRLADNVVLNRMTREMPDDHKTPYNFFGSTGNWTWVTDTVAAASTSNLKKPVLFYHVDTGEYIESSTEYVGRPSPNGQLAVSLVVKQDGNKSYQRHLYFCNLENGHSADVIIPLGDRYAHYPVWWESNDTVAYYRQYYEHPVTQHGPRQKPVLHMEVHRLRVPQF